MFTSQSQELGTWKTFLISVSASVRNLLLSRTEIWYSLYFANFFSSSNHQCREVTWRFKSHCSQGTVWVCHWRHSSKGNIRLIKVPWLFYTCTVIWTREREKKLFNTMFICCTWCHAAGQSRGCRPADCCPTVWQPDWLHRSYSCGKFNLSPATNLNLIILKRFIHLSIVWAPLQLERRLSWALWRMYWLLGGVNHWTPT